jgi:hypothetical protein
MRHSRQRLALITGGALLVSVGLVLVACSDNTVEPLPGVPEDDVDGGATDARTADRRGAPGPDDEDGGGDCGTAPRVRGVTTGFFCTGFRRDGGTTDASATSCDHDETCCNSGAIPGSSPAIYPSFCAATPRADKGLQNQPACADQAASLGATWIAEGSFTWECADKNSCNAGQVCCLFTKEGETDNANIGPSQDDRLAGCNAKQAFKHGGTYCAMECAETDVKLCSSTDENCGSKKCTAFRGGPGSRDLAYCN